MHDNEPLVFGERPAALCAGIQRALESVRPHPDGGYRWSGRVAHLGLPLSRALYRAEAEVLIEEADALQRPDAIPRTENERKMAAFARISERVRPGRASSLT
jgi:hypothetical protein